MRIDSQDHFKSVEWRVVDTIKFKAGAPNTTEDDPAHVEDPRWSEVIPWLHRALANPTGNVVLPEMPRRFETPDQAACAYWEAPLYMMRALLGWERPGLGLLWLYQNLRLARADLRLELLDVCWNNENQLDLLAAHLWRDGTQQQKHDAKDRDESAVSDIGPDANWWPMFHRRFANPGFHNPYFGGENPLHLNHTRNAVRDMEDATYDWCVDKASKRATLNVHRMRGWLGLLESVTAERLNHSAGEWRVDVVSKPVGWIGCFTKSSTTGRWHVGAEEVHLVGNVPGLIHP